MFFGSKRTSDAFRLEVLPSIRRAEIEHPLIKFRHLLRRRKVPPRHPAAVFTNRKCFFGVARNGRGVGVNGEGMGKDGIKKAEGKN